VEGVRPDPTKTKKAVKKMFKNLLRLAGIGLIAFGLLSDYSSGWKIGLVAAGFVTMFIGGGPG